jgi:hypothetical protein
MDWGANSMPGGGIQLARKKQILILIVYLVGTANDPIGSSLREQHRELNIGAIPLPHGAVELRRESRFPEEGKGPYLSQPEGFVLTPASQFYIADVLNNEIYAFDLSGKHVLTFGRTGQGPGDFIKPISIALLKNGLLVREAGNMRIQFFDFFGKYLDSFKIFRSYLSIATNGVCIYAAPMLQDHGPDAKHSTLIDILSLDGRLMHSFGVPLDVANPWLNQVILSVGSGNELWVTFMFFPIVRKYTTDGKLLAEYHYQYEIAERKEAFNVDGVKNRSDVFVPVVGASFASDGGLYLVDSVAGNRILLFFMKDDGQISEFYWAPIERKGFSCSGLITREGGIRKTFYILNKSEACVDIYSPLR